MESQIKKCAVISGAPDADIEYIQKNINLYDYIICADSGYLKCSSLNIKPDLIAGDFDSSPEPVTDAEKIVLSTHKDDTDTTFAVKEAIRRGFKRIDLYGVLGTRFDHSYGNLMLLELCRQNGVECKIYSANNCIYLCCDKTYIYKNNGYMYFSLYPFLSECSGVTINGGEYPLNNVHLPQYANYCQSNEVSGEYAEVSVSSGNLMIILGTD